MQEAFETLANEIVKQAAAIHEKIVAEPNTYTQKHATDLFGLYFAANDLAKSAKTLGVSKEIIERLRYEGSLARAAAHEYAATQDAAETKIYNDNIPLLDNDDE